MITAALPTGVQHELDAAIMRTGPTPALDRAAALLPKLLQASPERVEMLFKCVLMLEDFEASKPLDIVV